MASTWFITGTSTGIGRALTEQLLARGDRVAATVRKAGALADLQARYGDALWVATLDVTDTDAIRLVVDRAFGELGRIDVLVNNAGYAVFGAAEEASDEQIRHQLDTNVIGSIQVIRAALPHLRRQGGGRVLQVSSEGGQTTYPNFSLYHASKWAIEGFIESTAQDTAAFGIQYTIVQPGPTNTGFAAGLVIPMPMAEYESTAAGELRARLKGGNFAIRGNAAKMAGAMIDSVTRQPAPLRLTLGSDAYDHVHASLSARLAALEAQKDLAMAMDDDV